MKWRSIVGVLLAVVVSLTVPVASVFADEPTTSTKEGCHPPEWHPPMRVYGNAAFPEGTTVKVWVTVELAEENCYPGFPQFIGQFTGKVAETQVLHWGGEWNGKWIENFYFVDIPWDCWGTSEVEGLAFYCGAVKNTVLVKVNDFVVGIKEWIGGDVFTDITTGGQQTIELNIAPPLNVNDTRFLRPRKLPSLLPREP